MLAPVGSAASRSCSSSNCTSITSMVCRRALRWGQGFACRTSAATSRAWLRREDNYVYWCLAACRNAGHASAERHQIKERDGARFSIGDALGQTGLLRSDVAGRVGEAVRAVRRVLAEDAVTHVEDEVERRTQRRPSLEGDAVRWERWSLARKGPVAPDAGASASCETGRLHGSQDRRRVKTGLRHRPRGRSRDLSSTRKKRARSAEEARACVSTTSISWRRRSLRSRSEPAPRFVSARSRSP